MPRLLDLFCGAGGAAMGYHRAGFDEIVGVDIHPQKNYPFTFIQGDALEYVAAHGQEFDVIHASPPCQRYSRMTRTAGTQGNHPDLVAATRNALQATGKPFIIENVAGSPLRDPVVLCGTMFPGLKVYRHRLFESCVPLIAPKHSKHIERIPKAGRGASATGWISVAGHFSNVQAGRDAMGIDWMKQHELAESIPPAYTEYLGKQLLHALEISPPLGAAIVSM